MADESTTKLQVDLSDLKKEFQEAQRHIRLVTSEFKASTAGMDRWSDNADGLSAKLKELGGILDAEKTKLSSLERQYALVAEEQGENSRGAEELMIKINNQRAAVGRIESAIDGYNSRLEDMRNAAEQTESATDKLKASISDQEKSLNDLKDKYTQLVLEQKDGTEEAQALARQIQDLSGELQENRTALNNAESAADDFDSTIEDMGESADDAGDGFTVMKGALADLLADGIQAVAEGLKEFMTNVDAAYNGFQAQTGASTSEMKEFKDEMDGLYVNAYGENLEDIGDKMAYIAHSTGEVDPKNIRDLTENAMALEDTFGSDFNETVRGVNNLMTHFGISAEEAFDLFAKGSQVGLDYTDELGDNVAEYSGNFQQAGYSAEEYFQLLANGTQNGAYTLDKVNDSINEVKNRLADGSIADTIGIFSQNTQDAFKAWQDGEGTMKDVIDSIVADINYCTDEQDALTMAAAAFGTMGEDSNLKVVKSLTSVGDEFKNVSGTMEDVKKIKYDDVATQFTELGRMLQMELIAPLAEKALPYFKDLGNTAIKNIDKIVPVVKTLGTAMAAVFVVNKIATFTKSIMTMVEAYNALKVSTEAATAATTLSNAAFLANPLTLGVVAAFAALAAAYYETSKQQQAMKDKYYELSDVEKQNKDNVDALYDSYTQMKTARDESMGAISSEYGNLQALSDELDGIVDQNGKVKEGYEDRVGVITGILSEALGIEIDMTGDVIDQYNILKASIDDVIESKKSQAIVDSMQADYQDAIANQTQALTELQTATDSVAATEQELTDARAAAQEIAEQYSTSMSDEEMLAWADANSVAEEKVRGLKSQLEENNDTLDKAQETYTGYVSTIENYEGLVGAIASGDAAEIEDAMNKALYSFITAETGTKESLENQVSNMEENYDSLKRAVAEGAPGVTQEMVDTAADMVEKSVDELNKFNGKAAAAGTTGSQGYADAFAGNAPAAVDAALQFGSPLINTLSGLDTKTVADEKTADWNDTIASKGPDAIASANILGNPLIATLSALDTWTIGADKGQDLADGAAGLSTTIYGTGKGLGGTLNSGLCAFDTSVTGSGQTTDFNGGVLSVDTYGPGQTIASNAKSGAESVDTTSSGENFGHGFINGIANMVASAWEAAKSLAQNAWDGLKKGQQEGSPSKLTYKSGEFFVDGYANAIADSAKTAVKKARELGRSAVDALNAATSDGVNGLDLGTMSAGITAARQAVARPGVGGVTTNNQTSNIYNFYQTNNSPRSLSRLEIYRQTKNQLNLAKGV